MDILATSPIPPLGRVPDGEPSVDPTGLLTLPAHCSPAPLPSAASAANQGHYLTSSKEKPHLQGLTGSISAEKKKTIYSVIIGSHHSVRLMVSIADTQFQQKQPQR